jgi:inward rectifier potassium channel
MAPPDDDRSTDASSSEGEHKPPPRPTMERIVDARGRVNFDRIGAPRAPLTVLYHSLLTARYSTVVAMFLAVYLVGNFVFAGLYLLGGDVIAGARPGSFADVFFFSVQTMTTIGYGTMTPQGTYANVLVTAEAFSGLLGFSLATGLLFAKFSRPSSRVLFADKLVVDHWQGGNMALKIRVANGRANQIAEAGVTLTLIWDETLDDGSRFRRFHELPLVRSHTPIFALTWTLVHPLDEHSPLTGLTRKDLEARSAELLLALTGIDETFAQGVQSRRAWAPSEIEWHARYADIIDVSSDGRRVIDYRNMHSTIPHDVDAPHDEGDDDDGGPDSRP